MADRNIKGLLLSVLLVLSLAQLALAHWSWNSEEDNWYRKPKVHGGKKLHTKKHGGFYINNGKPSASDDDDERKPAAAYYKKPYKLSPFNKKPYKLSPFNKPYYKYKPSSYKAKLPETKPKPFYKPNPLYYRRKPKRPSYDPKPYYNNIKPRPVYTNPEPEPIYTKPLPEIDEPLSEPKKPYSYYRDPVPENEPAQEPEVPAPEKPAYTSPAASSSEREWLDPHNAARAEVGLPPMVWSDEVAQYAQSWANQRLASGCGLQHSGGPYGENIFWGSGGGYGAAECVAAWVKEKESYNYADNSCSDGDCGHYTQIIWAKSVHLGCARVQCDSGDVFMTCNYDPPGNYIGTKPY